MALAARLRMGAPLRRSSQTSRLLLAVVLAPLVGLIGVVLAEAVPDGRIAAHLTAAMQRGELSAADRSISMLGTTADHYAECTAVMVGLGDRAGSNIVRRAMYSSTSYGCGPAMTELDWFAQTGLLAVQPDYMRYWHGYAIVTRPALAIVGLSGTRWLSFAILGVAIGGFARAVGRRFGWLVATIAFAPGLLTTDMIVGGFSIAHAIGLATAWVGGWFVLDRVGKERSWRVAALAAALGGALNAYFDLMVAIPASLALCAVGAGLGVQRAGEQGPRVRDTAESLLGAVGGWALGFGAMWASKWVFAGLFVDRRRIIDSVRNQIEFRTGGDYEGVTGTRLTGFTKNVSAWFDQPLTPLVVLATTAALAWLLWRREQRPADVAPWGRVAAVVGCGALVAVPFAGWYVALNNHNQIHYWLTYRSVAIAFGALAAFAAAVISGGTLDGTIGGNPPSRLGRAVDTIDRNGVDEVITSEPSEERDIGPQ